MLVPFAALLSPLRWITGKGACLSTDPPEDACGLPVRIIF